MKINNKKLGLIFIDLQNEYFQKGGILEVPDGIKVLERAMMILKTGRELGIPVFHVRHISRDPLDNTFKAGSEKVEFRQDVMPQKDEIVITKSRPGAFYLTGLDDRLRKKNIDTLALIGFLSFMCVDTTAREAHARGYDVLFIKDATASINIGGIPAGRIHEVTCAIQDWLFSKVISTEELISIMKEG